MRTQSKTMQFIDFQCENLGLEQKTLFERSKTLLNLYRHVVWTVKTRASNLRQEIIGTYGMQLNTALLYLSDLAPATTRAGFESKVNQLFEAKWLIDLADLALQSVSCYGDSCYLGAQKRTEALRKNKIDKPIRYKIKRHPRKTTPPAPKPKSSAGNTINLLYEPKLSTSLLL